MIKITYNIYFSIVDGQCIAVGVNHEEVTARVDDSGTMFQRIWRAMKGHRDTMTSKLA